MIEDHPPGVSSRAVDTAHGAGWTPGLTFDLTSGTLRIHVRGDLDVRTSPELVQAIGLGVSARMRVVVDCEQLTFIDSCGLRALFGEHDGAHVSVVHLHGYPQRVADLLGYQTAPRARAVGTAGPRRTPS